MDLLLTFDVAKFIPLIIVLFLAAYQDHKTGEAKNKLWLYAPIGLALTITEILINPELALIFLLSILGTASISLLLFYTGAWGGADTKALLTIAVSTPLTPLITVYPTITALITVTVACLAAIPQILIKKRKTIRFLPYILIGLVVSMLV